MPLALIVHELVLNAVKHGGRQHGDVRVAVGAGAGRQEVCLCVSNPGHWPKAPSGTQVGLELVATLMPRTGATLVLEQAGGRAVARLCLQPPVLQPAAVETTLEHHD